MLVNESYLRRETNAELISGYDINPFQFSDAFHIETSHLICSSNQMTGFYMKCNTELKWVNK